MIKKSVIEAVSKQIQHEQQNAHIYQAVALYFENLNLRGLAAWMTKQAGDERVHADKFIHHLLDRGTAVQLAALSAPKVSFATPLEAAECVLALEQSTTALIHKLYELADREGDYALEVLLHWFINEQVEEEQWATELTSQMGQFHKSAGQLYMLDHHWGNRAKQE